MSNIFYIVGVVVASDCYRLLPRTEVVAQRAPVPERNFK